MSVRVRLAIRYGLTALRWACILSLVVWFVGFALDVAAQVAPQGGTCQVAFGEVVYRFPCVRTTDPDASTSFQFRSSRFDLDETFGAAPAVVPDLGPLDLGADGGTDSGVESNYPAARTVSARTFYWGNSTVSHMDTDSGATALTNIGVNVDDIAGALGISGNCQDGKFATQLTPTMFSGFPAPAALTSDMTLGSSCWSGTFAGSDYSIGQILDNNFTYDRSAAPIAGWGDVSAAASLISGAMAAEPGLTLWYLYSPQPDLNPALYTWDTWRNTYLQASQLDYNEIQDSLTVSGATVLMVPIAEVLAGLLQSGGLMADFTEGQLFTDDAPHENETMAHLMGAIVFSVIYRQPIPSSYDPPARVDATYAARFDAIAAYIWNRLLEPDLRTRVFGPFLSDSVPADAGVVADAGIVADAGAVADAGTVGPVSKPEVGSFVLNSSVPYSGSLVAAFECGGTVGAALPTTLTAEVGSATMTLDGAPTASTTYVAAPGIYRTACRLGTALSYEGTGAWVASLRTGASNGFTFEGIVSYPTLPASDASLFIASRADFTEIPADAEYIGSDLTFRLNRLGVDGTPVTGATTIAAATPVHFIVAADYATGSGYVRVNGTELVGSSFTGSSTAAADMASVFWSLGSGADWISMRAYSTALSTAQAQAQEADPFLIVAGAP